MKRNLFKNYIFYILYQVFSILIPFLVVPYTTRVLGAQALGTNALSSSFVQWFVIFGYMGIAIYGNKEIARVRDDREKLSRTFMGIFIMQVMNMLVALVLYFVFIYFVGVNEKTIYYIQGFALLATIFDITWFFLGVEDFKKASLRSIFFRVVNVALIFTFVKSSQDLSTFVWINVLTSIASQIVLFFQLKDYIDLRFVSIPSAYRDHLRGNLVLFVPQIAISIYSVLDQTMTGLIADEVQLAYYQQAIRFDKMFLYFITSIGMVMLPRIANEHAKGAVDTIHLYLNYTLKLALYLSIPMMFGMMGVAPFFIKWFLAPEFEIVGFLIALMSPIIIFIALSNVFGTQFLVPTNRIKAYSHSVIIGAVVNFIMNLIFLPMFGAIGAAISVLAAELSVTGYQLFAIRGLIKWDTRLKNLLIYTCSGLVMGITVYVIGSSLKANIITNLIQVLIGGLLYMTLLTILKEDFHMIVLENIMKIIKRRKI